MREVCNSCGKQFMMHAGVPTEDYLKVSKQWGYFSGHDGEVHTFCLCEDCYGRLISQFVIPLQKKEAVELL